MEYYHCLKCGRNLEKSEIVSKSIESPKVFNGRSVTMLWGVSLPATAKYYCRKHNIPIEIKNK